MIIVIAIALASIYAILLILLLLGYYHTAKQSYSNVKADGVSVIVAFRNEVENLPELIKTFNSQTLPVVQWEVIFVDDNSSDASISVINSNPKNFRFKLIQLSGVEGKKHAIIEGVKNTRYNLIAITDADCTPSKFWLDSLVEHGDIALIQRPVMVAPSYSIANMFEALDYASLMAVSAGSFGLGRPVIAASANLTFRKDLVGVNETTLQTDISSGDDMFLLHTAKQNKGNKLMFNLGANGFVTTKFEGGFSGFIRRRKRWASKASNYKDFDTILVATVVLLFNLSIVFFALGSLLEFISIYNLLIALVVKIFTDFPLLFVFLKRTKQLKLMLVFLPLQFIYPFYISYSAIAGLFGGQIWKGRPVN